VNRHADGSLVDERAVPRSTAAVQSSAIRAKKFRFDSIRQSDKFAACTLISK